MLPHKCTALLMLLSIEKSNQCSFGTRKQQLTGYGVSNYTRHKTLHVCFEDRPPYKLSKRKLQAALMGSRFLPYEALGI